MSTAVILTSINTSSTVTLIMRISMNTVCYESKKKTTTFERFYKSSKNPSKKGNFPKIE